MPDELVDRRAVLRWGGVAALAVAGAACTTASHHTVPTGASTVHAGAAPPWSQLAGQLAGRLVLPTTPGYAIDKQLFDPRFDVVQPAAIAYCANPSDVQRCIAFARAHGVPFTARAGGHSYAGYSTTTGLVVDVTPMRSVSVAGGVATIGAGARLIDIYTALNARGLSIPGGSCPSVGISGLALGGGIGVVSREHGLTCDAVRGFQMVTADSQVVVANAATNPDLFWAGRGGGGGNFGIVTHFTFATFPTSNVALFTVRWPWAAAADLVHAWMHWIGTTPDAMWANCILESPSNPAQPPVLQVSGLYLGPETTANAIVNQLIAAIPIAHASYFIETRPLAHAMYVEAGCASLSPAACHVQGWSPGGTLPRAPSFAGSSFVRSPLSDAGVAAVVSGINGRVVNKQPGAIAFDAYGGAINRVSPTATAFVHRDALACAQFSVSYPVGTSAATVTAYKNWLAAYRASVERYMGPGAYQNYIDPTQPNWQSAYYGVNLPRLRTIKKKWDPDNAFHFAQSIPPA